jgi:hypothetical protein
MYDRVCMYCMYVSMHVRLMCKKNYCCEIQISENRMVSRNKQTLQNLLNKGMAQKGMFHPLLLLLLLCLFACIRMYMGMHVCSRICMHVCIYVCMHVHRVSQEERSIFWEVIISAILSNIYMYMCPIPNGFRDTLHTVQTSNTPSPHTSCKVH